MALRFAVAMNKGGVGKTSFTLNEAWSLARILRAAKPDARVLIIDVDTQAGATQLLTGHRFTDKQPTVSTLLSGQYTFDEVLVRLEDSEFLEDDDTRAAFEGIDVIPACHEGTIRLGGPEEFWVLRDILDEAEKSGALTHDIVLMDCGYGDSDLNTLAIVAADHIMAVTNVTTLGMNGAAQLIEKVAKMRRSFVHLRISGLVLNDYTANELADQQVLEDFREQLSELLWEPPIPRRTIVKRSQVAGLPVGLFAVRGAKELVQRYDDIAERMLTLEITR
ncbi:MAG TPA: ParA family protein [Nakamurella sp.]|nr:ParA family protein [Nakamurella sp.]